MKLYFIIKIVWKNCENGMRKNLAEGSTIIDDFSKDLIEILLKIWGELQISTNQKKIEVNLLLKFFCRYWFTTNFLTDPEPIYLFSKLVIFAETTWKRLIYSIINQTFAEVSAALIIKSCNPKDLVFQKIPVNEKGENKKYFQVEELFWKQSFN